MTPAQRVNLGRLLKPRHMAFIGGRDAALAIGEARRIGYSGAIWPVNPKRETIEGIACVASVDDLPEAPDAVFLAIPVPQVVQTVKRLGEMGAGGIVCYTAGFGEAGADGQAAEQALIESAGSMALVGPNCYGVINYLDKIALWPFAHGGEAPDHGAAIITQSGMLSSDLTMNQRSVPITHMISIGNQAILTIEDFVDTLCEQPCVRAIGLHIEGLRDVRRFAEVALKAIDHGKPIVALKTGSSDIGKSLASSHTGSLSGEDDLYDALFRRTGIVRVFSPAQMLETLKFLCIAGAPGGTRIAGFTCSGGGAAMLADHGDKVGLEFPQYQTATDERLKGLLPNAATVSNPLDYTTPIWGQAERTKPVFAAALAETFDAAVLVQDYPVAGLDESRPLYLADGDAFADAALAAGTPAAICSTLPENLDKGTRRHFSNRGIAPMQGINETLEAIAAAACWAQARNRIKQARPGDLLTVNVHPELQAIDEVTAKRDVAAAGLSVPDGKVCSASDAASVAAALGFPVALKMVSPALLHKTEVGAVVLGLNTPDAVGQAVAQMQAAVTARQPEALSGTFLVERMQSTPLAELIVGVRTDDQFGLAMTIGSGGSLVELVGDSTTLLLPCTEDDVVRAIEELKVSRLLTGFRGRAKADVAKLASDLMKLARYMEEHRGRVAELEINPLLVYENGVCAVDALMLVYELT